MSEICNTYFLFGNKANIHVSIKNLKLQMQWTNSKHVHSDSKPVLYIRFSASKSKILRYTVQVYLRNDCSDQTQVELGFEVTALPELQPESVCAN